VPSNIVRGAHLEVSCYGPNFDQARPWRSSRPWGAAPMATREFPFIPLEAIRAAGLELSAALSRARTEVGADRYQSRIFSPRFTGNTVLGRRASASVERQSGPFWPSMYRSQREAHDEGCSSRAISGASSYSRWLETLGITPHRQEQHVPHALRISFQVLRTRRVRCEPKLGLDNGSVSEVRYLFADPALLQAT
jgi:hypothetical protein